MEFKIIKTKEIQPNSYNPNEMKPDVFEHLKVRISNSGFIDPVLVRKKGNYYEIIDGEHRYNALNELGIDEIPCIVVDMNDADAKVQTINLNTIKGNFNPVKLAKFFERLRIVYTDEEISKLLNINKQSLDDYKLLLKSPSEIEDGTDVHAAQQQEKNKKYTIMIPKSQYQFVMDVLNAINVDTNQAVVELANWYIGEENGV